MIDIDELLRTAMAEHTQELVVDPGTAARALRAARRVRRRHLTAMVTAALIVAAAVPITVRWQGADLGVQASTTPKPPPAKLATVAPPSPRCGFPTDRLPSQVPAGAVHRVGTLTPGQEELLWVGEDGALFVGSQATTGGPMVASVANPMTILNCGKALLLWSSDAGPAAIQTRVRTLVYGAVRGHATRVDLRLPHGDVRAQLAPDPAGQNTLFWTITEDFTGGGAVADPNATHTFGPDSYSMSLTAYDGNRQLVSCTLRDCVPPQQVQGQYAPGAPKPRTEHPAS